MSDTEVDLESAQEPDSDAASRARARGGRPLRTWLYPALVVGAFLLGLLTSDLAWGRQPKVTVVESQAPAARSSSPTTAAPAVDYAALLEEVNPPQGYTLPAQYGDLGPRLVEGGVIDYDAFAGVLQNSGEPLSPDQIEILKQGSDGPIVISSRNAHFLLNFFWAVGLANKNNILTDGPMTQNGDGKVENYASTGGWNLAKKPVTELYASMELIPLTPEQQARVEEVAAAVYRPCCGNPTIFPDCNHGMAMLGLLELMASKGASADDMFKAAKYVNAYWFPQQALEAAIYLKAKQNVDFAHADARTVTGEQFFSASGARQLHAALQSQGLLPAAPNGGGGCGS